MILNILFQLNKRTVSDGSWVVQEEVSESDYTPRWELGTGGGGAESAQLKISCDSWRLKFEIPKILIFPPNN